MDETSLGDGSIPPSRCFGSAPEGRRVSGELASTFRLGAVVCHDPAHHARLIKVEHAAHANRVDAGRPSGLASDFSLDGDTPVVREHRAGIKMQIWNRC